MHEIERLLFADVLVQRAAKVVGDVIFTVGERARAAELSDSLEKLKKLKIRFTEAMQGEDD